MLSFHTFTRSPVRASASRPAPRWTRAVLASVLTAALVACGGGGGADSSTPDAGTPAVVSYTSGAISGFGSVIVNGVRFDDSAATVLDDNGRSVSRDALKLGSHVEIEGGRVDRSSGRAKAVQIRIGSELVGPVTAVDLLASTVSTLGQTVEVLPSTVFDDSLPGGLAALSVGQVVEIHAQLDTTRGVYVASRIEPETGASAYKLRGVVSALDTAAKTFAMGPALISYAGVTNVPGNLANGAWLKVRLATRPVNGVWQAQSLDNGQRRHGEDHAEAEMKGYITAWTSATQFSVDGQPVDASGATFREGQAGVVMGAFVEVEGAIVNGVLIATQVHLEDEHDRGHGEDFELHGTLSGLDTSARTFQLRGVTVDYGAVTDWRDLVEADLVNGLPVEVKGDLSSDGTRLVATRIHRES